MPLLCAAMWSLGAHSTCRVIGTHIASPGFIQRTPCCSMLPLMYLTRSLFQNMHIIQRLKVIKWHKQSVQAVDTATLQFRLPAIS